jgi:hypothetical protein
MVVVVGGMALLPARAAVFSREKEGVREER